jgi:YHS domain-containing protein
MLRISNSAIRGLGAACLLLTLGVAVPGFAAPVQDVNVSAGLTAQGAPLALRGYDPVAYFEAGAPQLGKAEHSVAHGGATYRFVSKANQRRFEREPQRYLPQYGGFCAFGVSVGAKFDGDPEVWKIVDDKLYLNLNPEIQKSWNADTAAAIRKADGHWPKIRTAAPETLKPQG